MTLGWGCSAGVRQESEGGDGEGDKGDTCGGPSQVLFSPSPQNLGSENVAGGREGRERAGQRISSLVSGKGRQGQARRVASSNAQGLLYLLRELAAAPGRLGGELAPERLWRALAASGGARWAPTWPRMGDSRQHVQGPTEPEASGLDPFFGRSPRSGLQERNFFWLFSPSSLIWGTATPP